MNLIENIARRTLRWEFEMRRPVLIEKIAQPYWEERGFGETFLRDAWTRFLSTDEVRFRERFRENRPDKFLHTDPWTGRQLWRHFPDFDAAELVELIEGFKISDWEDVCGEKYPQEYFLWALRNRRRNPFEVCFFGQITVDLVCQIRDTLVSGFFMGNTEFMEEDRVYFHLRAHGYKPAKVAQLFGFWKTFIAFGHRQMLVDGYSSAYISANKKQLRAAGVSLADSDEKDLDTFNLTHADLEELKNFKFDPNDPRYQPNQTDDQIPIPDQWEVWKKKIEKEKADKASQNV